MIIFEGEMFFDKIILSVDEYKTFKLYIEPESYDNEYLFGLSLPYEYVFTYKYVQDCLGKRSRTYVEWTMNNQKLYSLDDTFPPVEGWDEPQVNELLLHIKKKIS